MSTDLLTALRAADPANGPTYDEAALRDRARAICGAVQQRVAAERLVVDGRSYAPRQRPSRVVTAVGVAAVLAATAVAVPTIVHRTSAQQDAAQERAAAGGVADDTVDTITAVDPPVRADQYWKITTTGFVLAQTQGTGEVTAALVREDRVDYLPVDGSRSTYAVTGPSTVVDQLSGVSTGHDPSAAAGVEEVPVTTEPSWQAPTPTFLQTLPRDPAALLARLRTDSAGAGQSPDGEVVVFVADVLRAGLVPADVRDTLYHALALVPDVAVTADPGADTVTFGYREAVSGVRQEIVVDTATGAFAGERQIATTTLGAIPAGTAIEQTAVSREPVDAVPADVVTAAGGGTCAVAADLTVTCSP